VSIRRALGVSGERRPVRDLQNRLAERETTRGLDARRFVEDNVYYGIGGTILIVLIVLFLLGRL
jgi:hypothetical protein